jgi:23S rRNA (guanosine2251-2'-O)-methyltransferase
MVARKGTGGYGRKKLSGKGPTPKAEDRPYHPAAKKKAAAAKRAPRDRDSSAAPRSSSRAKSSAVSDVIAGRNSVVEALRQGIPAKSLFMAHGIDVDDRVREAIRIAQTRGIDIHEAARTDLDRVTGGAVHQGLALRIPEYEYLATDELLAIGGDRSLIVALDGITDPRNLGAILRSAGAFGAHGVLIPERRSVGMTASAWKTSAGAAARVPVAQAVNLVRALQQLAKAGCMIVGLDADGDHTVAESRLLDGPLVIVVGSEGKGLGRLVREQCDEILSVPMHTSTESLNAGIAASIALYEVAKARAQ